MRCIFNCALVCALLLSSLNSSSVSAAIYAPGDSVDGVQGEVFGWSRSDTNSAYNAWDIFEGTFSAGGNPFSDSSPDVAGQFGTPIGTINVGPGTFNVGGNAYSNSFALDFNSVVPSGTGSTNTRIVAQFETGGSELDYSSILLSTNSATDGTIVPGMVKEISRVALGGFGGAEVQYLALWDIVGSQAEYRIDFNASASSLSLREFHVDSFTQSTPFVTPVAVPEPSSFALIGLAGLGCWVKRRVRRRLPTDA